MCEYCGDKTPEQRGVLIAGAKRMRRQLTNMADYYEDLAYGRVNPHEDQTRNIAGRQLIRFLVEDWL